MLRGASAEALAELGVQVEKTRTQADAATLGEQLFAVAQLLRGEAALRRVLTDAAVEADAKAGLATAVLASSLGEDAMALVEDAVRRRWTGSADLADVLEQLGIVALVQSAGAKGDRITDELFAVRRLVDSSNDLREALSAPARSVADRTALLDGLLRDETLLATERLLAQAIAATGSFDAALRRFQQLAAEARNETVATVHAARELSEQERSRLVAALGTQYDTTVHLQVVVDPSLVGGLRVEIRDDVIDGTVVGRLDDARRQLVG